MLRQSDGNSWGSKVYGSACGGSAMTCFDDFME
jgi:hypothetical protein